MSVFEYICIRLLSIRSITTFCQQKKISEKIWKLNFLTLRIYLSFFSYSLFRKAEWPASYRRSMISQSLRQVNALLLRHSAARIPSKKAENSKRSERIKDELGSISIKWSYKINVKNAHSDLSKDFCSLH